MRTLIVTAADEGFVPLLRGLLGSLAQFDVPLHADIALLDVGLGEASRTWASRQVRHIVEPGWDLPVPQPQRAHSPHLRSLTARPFLRDHFPGYDIYLWIDADAWVQERFAIEWLQTAAAGGALAAVPQIDRAYRHSAGSLEWRAQRMRDYFGEQAVHRLLWDTYFNAGVFALHASAPHWLSWARHFETGLRASDDAPCCDQTALNHAIWTDRLAAYPLPALCNWLCHLAKPAVEWPGGKLLEPLFPARRLGIVHLTGRTKDATVDPGHAGALPVSLRFPQPVS